MNHQRNSTIKGQLLIESFVAISIAVVGLLGIITLLSRSLSLNRLIANQYIANHLAAEGIEIIKNSIDANIMRGFPWNQGLSDGAYEVAGTHTADSVFINYRGGGTSCDGVASGRQLSFNDTYRTYVYGVADSLVPFKRCVEVRSIVASSTDTVEELAVSSRVFWSDLGGAEFDIVVEDHFLNWR
ncbi:MAG: hypothetical protein A2586_02240 [Candidatus Harrisonbacteria bacterium RIFOXYD1_FULL_40_9]|uniref:Type 4 fimbrial biogenesis protein PilX N-terminal domain-containing protein n=1 Tax=Candidatus Harrisonbacteria bacterium RIFOXYD1_FULL_40_9 TaxID=1798412 RepID=A0A1G1ZW86_9BACT|nr:MAG: hypothetical protein A2586_02240 [Candidatus Harrisonbacteria bacterium RIFOXYD1_FULL_40_9]